MRLLPSTSSASRFGSESCETPAMTTAPASSSTISDSFSSPNSAVSPGAAEAVSRFSTSRVAAPPPYLSRCLPAACRGRAGTSRSSLSEPPESEEGAYFGADLLCGSTFTGLGPGLFPGPGHGGVLGVERLCGFTGTDLGAISPPP